MHPPTLSRFLIQIVVNAATSKGSTRYVQFHILVYFSTQVPMVNYILYIRVSNQSTESDDGGSCQKFYRPLELTGIYAENFSVPDRPFSVLFGGKCPFRCLAGSRLGLHCLLNAADFGYSYSSADIVLTVIKILRLKTF